jgi:tRNA (cmo5U34)-methyltransferase
MFNKHSKLVKEHFDKEYQEYDGLIRKLIPRYNEMHRLVIGSLNFPTNSKLKILDLGIGTGQTTLEVLQKFPNAQIDGVDLSEKMILQAKIRLKDHLDRARFFQEDILKVKLIHKYDAVISVLCIHHLDSKQKKEFFPKVFNCLKEGGIFVIADIIKFDSEKETKEKEQEWKNFLAENFEEKEANFWFENYKIEDLPDSTKSQLIWLKNSGFRETKSLWGYMNYAVFSGKK